MRGMAYRHTSFFHTGLLNESSPKGADEYSGIGGLMV